MATDILYLLYLIVIRDEQSSAMAVCGVEERHYTVCIHGRGKHIAVVVHYIIRLVLQFMFCHHGSICACQHSSLCDEYIYSSRNNIVVNGLEKPASHISMVTKIACVQHFFAITFYQKHVGINGRMANVVGGDANISHLLYFACSVSTKVLKCL